MSKILVAYFSASGTTARLAKTVAAAVGGDLHEIVPEKPYTSADLNWNNKQSRSSIEMSDKSFRPAIANHVDNIDEYDIIYVGFPIWWYVAPTIINTFLESNDLTGKTIIPFATSGGSSMGNTNAELANSCKGAILKDGKRFSTDVSKNEIKTWADSLNK